MRDLLNQTTNERILSIETGEPREYFDSELAEFGEEKWPKSQV